MHAKTKLLHLKIRRIQHTIGVMMLPSIIPFNTNLVVGVLIAVARRSLPRYGRAQTGLRSKVCFWFTDLSG